MIVAIIVIVFFAVVGGVGYYTWTVIQKTDPKNFDTSQGTNIQTAQDFLPFEEIKDDVINLGGHNYSALIEVSSLNYDLRTDEEREMIESSYRRWLNSLTTDISIFIQTKTIDMTTLLGNISEDLQEAQKTYPFLQEYGERYLQEMEYLTERIGNNKEKKKYVIVQQHFEPEMNASGSLSEKDIYEESVKELLLKANIIAEGLSGVGIKAEVLGTTEIADVLYSTLNRDSYSHISSITSGEFMRLLVESESDLKIDDIDSLDYVDNTLYTSMLSIQSQLRKDNLSLEERYAIEEVLKRLDEIRKSTTY